MERANVENPAPKDLLRLASSYPSYIRLIKDFELNQILQEKKYYNIFLSVDARTGKDVLVKKLLTPNCTPRKITQFIREVHILAKCNNQFIGKLVGFTVKEATALIIEYSPSIPFEKYIKDNPVTEENCTLWSTQVMAIASAMKHMHSLGFIHRDLKPKSIMIDKETKMPLIVDFINSRPISFTKPMTRRIGTLNFMAPELMIDHNYKKSVDAYSFGMMLYYIYEGMCPFDGVDDENLVRMVTLDNERPVIQHSPPKIRKLILKCWDQDPSKRPSFRKILERMTYGHYLHPDANKEEVQRVGKSYQKELKFNKNHKKKKPNSSIDDTSDVFNFLKLDQVKHRRLTSQQNMSSAYLYGTTSTPYFQLDIEPQEKPTRISHSPSSSSISLASRKAIKPIKSFAPAICSTLINSKDPNFDRVLDSTIMDLRPQQFPSFFEIISIHLSKANPEITEKIIEKCVHLADKSPNFLSYMAQCGFLELPVLRNDKYIEQAFHFAISLFLLRPKCVLPHLKSYLKHLISKKPEEMILIFSKYIQKHEFLPKSNAITDIFMEMYDIFKEIPAGIYFIKTFHYIINNITSFRETRMEGYRQAMSSFLRSTIVSILKQVYLAILSNFDSQFFIPFDHILAHIQNPELTDLVVSLLIRVEMMPISQRIPEVLILKLYSNPKAPLVLFKFSAQSIDTASIMFGNNLWMKYSIRPNDSYRIFLILLRYPSIKAQFHLIKGLAKLFVALTVVSSKDFLFSIGTLLQYTGFTKKFFKEFAEEKFFEQYFNLISQSSDLRILGSGVLALDVFARIGFHPAYLKLLPKFIDMISARDETTVLVIQICVTISNYEQCRKELRKLGIYDYFVAISEYEHYKELSKIFLSKFEQDIK